jgi:hypothetical protein
MILGRGSGDPNPLILGQLFRLFANRCDDLHFPRSHSLDGCGHLVLFSRYLVSEKYPSDHGGVASGGGLRASCGVAVRDRAASALPGSA